MKTPTRLEIFAQSAKKLRQDFEALGVVPHAASKGAEAERQFRDFLNAHLPKRFAAGAGFILDPTDVVSRQTDVVVYDAANCPLYRASDDAAIFPSNNVAAVIEVKSRLDKEQLIDAFEKIKEVKALRKMSLGDEGAPMMSQTLGCVFGYQSAITLDKVAEHYFDWLKTESVGHHPDCICVLDKGLVHLVAHFRGGPGWGLTFFEGLGEGAAEGGHLGVSVHHLGDNSLDSFFRILLAYLSLFRPMVDHPGLDWSKSLPKGMMKVSYLMSISFEQDPVERARKLEVYRREAIEMISRHPVPEEYPE